MLSNVVQCQLPLDCSIQLHKSVNNEKSIIQAIQTTGNEIRFRTYPVIKVNFPEGPDPAGVVEQTHVAVARPVELLDVHIAESLQEERPHVGSQAVSDRDPDPVESVIGPLPRRHQHRVVRPRHRLK